jgi:hypothetical protein
METDCGDIAGGKALLRPTALAAADETEREGITGAGEPSSRSSYSRYFFLAVFFLAFFFAAIVISLRVVD